MLFFSIGVFISSLSLFLLTNEISELAENTTGDSDKDDTIPAVASESVEPITEANNLFQKNRFQEALQIYLSELKQAETNGDKKLISKILNNIASVYYNLRDFTRVEEFWLRSAELKLEIGSFHELGHIYNNLGNLYSQLGDLDKSLSYFEKSLEYKNTYKQEKGISTTLNNLAGLYCLKQDYSRALEYLNKALEIARSEKNQIQIAFFLNNICRIYIEKNNSETALEYAKEAESFGDKIEDDLTKMQIYQNLTDCYLNLKDYEKAFFYQSNQIKIKEDIFHKEKMLEIENLKKKYLAEEMEQEIKMLIDSEIELKNAKERYQFLFDNSLRGILVVRKMAIEIVNKRFIEMSGYREDEIVGKKYYELFKNKDINSNISKLDGQELTLKNKLSTKGLTVEVNTKETIFEGKIVNLLFVTDVAKKRALEAQNIEREKLQAIIELAGAISHEMNQPLQSVMGYVELLLLKDYSSYGQIDYLKERLIKIGISLKRMDEITRKLTTITKYKTKDYVGQTRIVDILESVKEKLSDDE
ncbi:MAG: tetratricopeptide repeat protein [Candidatus Cloacimonetes bacterium]|nr:tetratricopeptide repeat protein [Candidatus Cloacimonadota bacterium]